MRQDFVVQVTHEGRPLGGVNIQVANNSGEKSNPVLSALTASDGTVHVSQLPPGEYWLNTDLLGISAGTQCFHIRAQPSRRAKKLVKYSWGDFAPSTRQLAGKLIDSQPHEGGTALERLLHPIDIPVGGAMFKLHNALTGTVFNTLSDAGGVFSFESIPDGIYVLHVQGGRAGAREYDSADILIRRSDRAAFNSVVLTRRDAGGGSCGGTSMELRTALN